MGNALKYLLQGFQDSYGRSSSQFAQQQQREAGLEHQLAIQTAKQEQEQAEQEKQTNIVRQLLSGKVREQGLTQTPLSIRKTEQPLSLGNMNQYETVEPEIKQQDIDRPIDQQEYINLFSQLDSKSRAVLSEYQKMNKADTFNYDKKSPVILKENPETKELVPTDKPNPFYEAPKKEYAKTEWRPQGLIGITREGQVELIPDTQPFYLPKEISKIQGYDKTGHKTEEITYDDGSKRVIRSGLTKGGGIGNEETFDKNLKSYYPKVDKLNALKVSYQKVLDTHERDSDVAVALRRQISDFTYNMESELYGSMPKDARNSVDGFYTFVKDKSKAQKIKYEDVLNSADAPALLEAWTQKKFADGEIDPRSAKIIILWGKFKFGYLPKVQKDAE